MQYVKEMFILVKADNARYFELRTERMTRREWYIKDTQERKRRKEQRLEFNANKIATSARILRETKKTQIKEESRPGPEKFLSAFSFISSISISGMKTGLDNWKCKTFNKQRQYFEFLHDFIYLYHIPEPLVFTSIQSEYAMNEKGKAIKVFDYDIIVLARVWLCDIVSGESFYKNNKNDFTKAEAHYFLISKMPYSGALSVIELYFYAKCKARNLDDNLCEVISKTFALKFARCFNNSIVTGFLDLLARHKDYNIDTGELGDICDFVNSKIGNKDATAFYFSGRTMSSVIALANEWHADQSWKTAMLNVLQGVKGKNRKDLFNQFWQGIPVNDFIFETDNFVWRVIQLRSAKYLLAEGRIMRNCVASYIDRCLSGSCGIFTVVYKNKSTQVTEKRATLEVLPSKELVQAKAKCNKLIDTETRKIVIRWAIDSGIKVTRSI
jgi:hypothetical protein